MLDEKLVAAGAIALAVTLFSIFSMRPLARKLGLVDKPDGRKRHSGRIPLIGGLCFFVGTLVGLCYLGYVDHFVMSLVTGATLVMVTGLVDDFHNLSVRSRLVVEIGVVGWVIAISGFYIDDIGPLLGNHGLKLGLLGIPFTIVAVIGLINAFNMLDGIDGLAAATAMISIVAMLAFGDFTGPSLGALMLLQILFASLIPYVCVNFGWPDGRKIFMGDAGSTLLGFLLAWSLVYLSHGAVARLQPVDVLWCVAFPVIETVAVMCRRARSGRSPFKPDRQHFHYLLLDAGYTPRASLLIIMTVISAMTAIGYGLRDAPQLVSAIAFLAVLVGYVLRLPQGIEFLRKQRTPSFGGAGRMPLFKLGDFGLGFPASRLNGEAEASRADVQEKNPVLLSSAPVALETSHSPVKALCVMAAPADATRIAPIAQQLSHDNRFESKVCIAAVSKQEAEHMQDMFDLHADFNVDIAELETKTPGVTSIALSGMERVLNDAMPDVVLVAGDAAATLATTLAAYSRDVPIVCVSAAEVPPEGGHRVDDADRKIIRALAALHVASTESVRSELMSEGVRAQRVLLVEDDGACQKILEALVELRPVRIEPKAVPPGIGTVIATAVESMQKAS
jgi:undecaprenyl-phosphate alpha-N-acetylglucosaminyl 1-phosphatetransferase